MKYRFSCTMIGSIAAALCLVAFGWLLGKYSASTEFIAHAFSWLVDVGTILAGLGTVCAAYVGYLALSAWKVQSKGQSNLTRLIECQEIMAVLCVELLEETTSLPKDKRDELYESFQRLLVNLAVVSRTSSYKSELLHIRQVLLVPSYVFRDSGIVWPDDKEKIKVAEKLLNNLIARW
ncbi:hypothetical protein KZY42_004452 [Vibrio vulnificus]|uniref:hypothetical protein n=1 Tax=Vibrio parahaemolyticus TaxID=670 RepID=UPI001112E137|nr:hypothetical protein [Vibrio parahaemolyticus]EHU9446940.1 hypothetical protein [Vibrio vulnificus]EKG2484568.1 hypothetical protein [Vibrio vulnificus]ELP6772741.1 hypothetical protein [Vibrio vulnificus]MCU8474446.1 hypothetical protein [Vibrio vulnificus]